MVQTPDIRSRVLVLAPTGRDAAVVVEQLRAAGLVGVACADLIQVIGKLEEGAGVAVIAEEAFRNDLAKLTNWVAEQDPWSDFPFVVVTSRHFYPKEDALRISLLEAAWKCLASGTTPLGCVSHERRQVRIAGAAAAIRNTNHAGGSAGQ